MESLNSLGLVSATLSISSRKLSTTFSPVCVVWGGGGGGGGGVGV